MQRTVVLSAAVLACLAAGCKNGKATSSANAASTEVSNPSGVIRLEGMYSYMADAGVFEDCATGVRWPVATEGDNAALERAYGKARAEPGAPLLVTVDGRIEMRPRPDARRKEAALIVERFDRVWPRETCGSLTPVSLENVKWALLDLNGKPIDVSSEARAPYLELNAEKKSAYGYGGCNRFFGSYEVGKHDSIKFGAIGATRMACPEGMNQEQALFTVLGRVTRYEIEGSKLRLYAGDELVARFQAQRLMKTE